MLLTAARATMGGASTGESEEEQAKFSGNSIIVVAGAGDDTVAVDVSAANNAPKVKVDGGTGNDRLHFTGKLKQDGQGSAVSGDGSHY